MMKLQIDQSFQFLYDENNYDNITLFFIHNYNYETGVKYTLPLKQLKKFIKADKKFRKRFTENDGEFQTFKYPATGECTFTSDNSYSGYIDIILVFNNHLPKYKISLEVQVSRDKIKQFLKEIKEKNKTHQEEQLAEFAKALVIDLQERAELEDNLKEN